MHNLKKKTKKGRVYGVFSGVWGFDWHVQFLTDMRTILVVSLVKKDDLFVRENIWFFDLKQTNSHKGKACGHKTTCEPVPRIFVVRNIQPLSSNSRIVKLQLRLCSNLIQHSAVKIYFE